LFFSFLIGLPIGLPWSPRAANQVAIATLQQHVGADGQFRGLFQPSGREGLGRQSKYCEAFLFEKIYKSAPPPE
jgi:hypothetical protein